jgi:heme/copper-type cytochrome/quinol oxidase subunit 2
MKDTSSFSALSFLVNATNLVLEVGLDTCLFITALNVELEHGDTTAHTIILVVHILTFAINIPVLFLAIFILIYKFKYLRKNTIKRDSPFKNKTYVKYLICMGCVLAVCITAVLLFFFLYLVPSKSLTSMPVADFFG